MSKCIKNARKTVTPKSIECGGTATVTISYTVDKCGFRAKDLKLCDCWGDCPKDAKIVETVSDDFEITAIGTPSHGTIAPVTLPAKSFTWNIGDVGSPHEKTNVSLSFTIKHVGTNSGSLKVNKSLVYTDNQNNHPDFGNPYINVGECEEECVSGADDDAVTVSTTVDNCIDTGFLEVDAFRMQTLGRILQLNIRVKNVCPNKRLSVAAILTETEDKEGNNPIVRGIKTFLVPAQGGDDCQDVCINCINFVAPEELVKDFDNTLDTTTLCRKRFFSATVIAHHADSDFEPCEDEDDEK